MTQDLLLAIQRYVRSQGSHIVILNYPYAPAVTRSYCVEWRKQFNLGSDQIYEPLFHASQRRFAEKNGMPYYDFTPFLRSLQDLQGIYWEENGHFSGKANALFAQEIVRFIAPLLPAKKQ
jgi:lysophospholipase L1-like esterase